MIHQIIIKKMMYAVDFIASTKKNIRDRSGWKYRFFGVPPGLFWRFCCSVCELASAPPIKSRGKQPSSIELFTPLTPNYRTRWRRWAHRAHSCSSHRQEKERRKDRAAQAKGERFCSRLLVVRVNVSRSAVESCLEVTLSSVGRRNLNERRLPFTPLQMLSLCFPLHLWFKDNKKNILPLAVPLFSPPIVHLCASIFALKKTKKANEQQSLFLPHIHTQPCRQEHKRSRSWKPCSFLVVACWSCRGGGTRAGGRERFLAHKGKRVAACF